MQESGNVPGGQGRSGKAWERTGERGKAKEGEERGHAGMAGDRRRERGAGNRGMLEWLGGLAIDLCGPYCIARAPWRTPKT